MDTPKWQHFLLIIILIAAAWLRLYRISLRTEFLGDQGRAGLIAMDMAKGNFPLLGPTVLSGQHLGPAFYYLASIPFIAGRFDPAWPAVATAVLGVATVFLLWRVAFALAGPVPAIAVSALWAVSPLLIAQDQVIWEPNIIPFFIFAWVIGMLRKSMPFAVIAGASLGTLLQLHYPNGIFVLLSIPVLWHRKKSYILAFSFSLLLTLAPFLWYEISHGFENVGGVLQSFTQAGGETSLTKRVVAWNILDYSAHVFTKAFPIAAGWQSALVLVGMFTVFLLRRDLRAAFLAIWFIAGIGALSVFRGVVFRHYLIFLIPVPFLALAMALKFLEKRIALRVLGMTIVLAMIGWQFTVALKPHVEPGDILRLNEMSRAAATLAGGRQFAFALISSRSFSDLHWRFYLRRAGIIPLSVTSEAAEYLLLACENLPCPTYKELSARAEVQVICYDPHCAGAYPKIRLQDWGLADEWKGDKGTIIFLRRAHLPIFPRSPDF